MTQKNVSLQEDVYKSLTLLKEKYMSYSDIILELIQEHNELVKLKADMEKCKPV